MFANDAKMANLSTGTCDNTDAPDTLSEPK